MTTYSLFPKYMRTKFRKKIGMFAKGLKKNIKISRLAPPKVAQAELGLLEDVDMVDQSITTHFKVETLIDKIIRLQILSGST